MRRDRFFALGFVLTALMGGGVALGSGCSDDDNVRVIEPLEGGGPNETSTADTASSPMCPSDVPVDHSSLAYEPPNAPQPGKCTGDDVTAMKDFIAQNPKASNEDFEAFVHNRSTSCHDCVFGDAAGSTWPPAPVKDGKVLTFDVGACYAIVSGDAKCGESVQNEWDCEFQVCALCDSATAQTTCRTQARTGICKAYQDASRAACAASPGVDAVCGSPFDSIRVLCISPQTPEAGTDAGSDAADAAEGG